FEDFAAPGAGEDGLKPGWINVEIIFARALRCAILFPKGGWMLFRGSLYGLLLSGFNHLRVPQRTPRWQMNDALSVRSVVKNDFSNSNAPACYMPLESLNGVLRKHHDIVMPTSICLIDRRRRNPGPQWVE
ncbi:MAG: hypothetical protein P8Z73_04305, partial [Desulfobacteraceae bacterium]